MYLRLNIDENTEISSHTILYFVLYVCGKVLDTVVPLSPSPSCCVVFSGLVSGWH